MSAPYFWHQPFRYLRYASHTKPALFWSLVLGAAGPVLFVGSIPVKRVMGIQNRPKVPATYPVPNRPRLIPVGYDDPE
ncbi:n19m, NADH-ubiquinone oxidoreductase 9.5 kDa subunit [Maublancomyces gigas]|uniref:N19m, NADH-ubiquinone oxidoreductase 9.5 kDa subunit n=1 Tax=Discina gigas TaxID=1032678 RepID=A0ABR3GJD4_9PEZI